MFKNKSLILLPIIFITNINCMQPKIRTVETKNVNVAVVEKLELLMNPNEIIGIAEIIFYKNCDYIKNQTFLKYIKIYDEYRKNGYGSSLIEHIKEKSKKNGIYMIKADAIPCKVDKTSEKYDIERGKLIRFYEANGFFLDDPKGYTATHVLPICGALLTKNKNCSIISN